MKYMAVLFLLMFSLFSCNKSNEVVEENKMEPVGAVQVSPEEIKTGCEALDKGDEEGLKHFYEKHKMDSSALFQICNAGEPDQEK